MKLGAAIAEIMKREGIDILCGYPVNHLIEFAADADIRPVMVRQERIGLHMADAISRVSSGRRIGAFCMQHGPGAENAMGGVAQCFGESVPVLVLPMGYARRISNIEPNFNSSQAMKAFSKSSEPIILASEVCNIFRRAFTRLKNGRGGPVIVEIPSDMWNEEVGEPLDYTPVLRTRSAADPVHVKEAAELLVAARRPVIYAGQGVHYARAWPQLRRLAERLAIPVVTSLGGKSSFPETHPLSLGSGGVAMPRAVPKFLAGADVIFGIGCSFTETSFAVAMPKGKTIIHSTLDPNHLNKDVEAKIGLTGDAGLVLDALLDEIGKQVTADRDASAVTAEIAAVHKEWLAKWLPKLTSSDAPLNPYRVLWELQHTVDINNTIITHDAGSPRDQLSPFWRAVAPLSYLGWGKTTQLGYGLGLAMGAKLAHPEKLCINVWGDAAIGFTGMDFETAVRERIPILSILLNNFSMAIELKVMPISTEKYRATDISGDYAAMARAFGGYGERITTPEEIKPAILRGIQKTQAGVPVLLEFITSKETEVSRPGT
ncbi:thiamine pyrophosphate-requiring protein [Bradyrhizobium sp.]|jgi:thiamine pyrophosphate-dependent acetolactate synthase large subunit-like protein|uniref:thiamine pyrophosphate-requiring protein n=1 Tax=Bradyrhizobium sp. TaxID=376 RepID=UPI002CB9AC5A|nr:thiamine pyrophosphate-requiring protein [Bradyrhizobium sp.]HWX61701.1 thiamine pyrophosphate-requiring protein [Bradyrhizobium sp.]